MLVRIRHYQRHRESAAAPVLGCRKTRGETPVWHMNGHHWRM